MKWRPLAVRSCLCYKLSLSVLVSVKPLTTLTICSSNWTSCFIFHCFPKPQTPTDAAPSAVFSLLPHTKPASMLLNMCAELLTTNYEFRNGQNHNTFVCRSQSLQLLLRSDCWHHTDCRQLGFTYQRTSSALQSARRNLPLKLA